MKDSISCFLTMNVIQKRDGNLRKRMKVKVGKIKMSFVDIRGIIAGDEKYLAAIKETVAEDLHKQKDSNEKYTKDLFYIAPLFYKMFSKLDKIIFLDIDLMFQDSIKNLWKEFPLQTKPGEKCIGVTHCP